MEYFLEEKEDSIRALKNKLYVSEKELTYLSSAFNKLMTGSQKLNEIISSTKSFGDKWGIHYEEGVFTSSRVVPKFVKSTTQESKLKFVIATPKGELVATSQPLSSIKLNISPKVSSFHRSSSGLFPFPIVPPTCHHYGEHGNLRHNYKKLTSHSFAYLCHLYGNVSHLSIFKLDLLHILGITWIFKKSTWFLV